MDIRQYLPLHPAAAQLRALEAEAATARGAESREPQVAAPPMETPAEVQLPTPEEPPAAPSPDRKVDLKRTDAEIRESYALRRLAEPDRAQAAFETKIQQLRKRFAELRQPPDEKDTAADLKAATEQAERENRLTAQLAALQERPEDRFFYTPAQLRRRRELYAEAQQELRELREAQVQRLKQALRLPPRTSTPVPDRLLREAEAELKAERARAQAALARLEREALDAAARVRLPAEAVEPVPRPSSVADPEAAASREQITEAIRHPAPAAQGPAAKPAASGANRMTAADAARTLRVSMLEDLKAAAMSAGRARGYEVTLKRGAPDRTAELRPLVRERLAELR